MKIQTRSILNVLAFICVAGAALDAKGVVPAPDGCYPNYTTAEGCNALKTLTTGAANTGIGWYSLFSNTAAGFNTGIGAGTLVLNAGDSNTAVGAAALLLNTTGTENTAVGAETLRDNVDGFSNTAIGQNALPANISGIGNTAIGRHALFNTTGNANIALGATAGEGLTTGDLNIDIGNPGVAAESNTIRIGNTGVHTATYIAGISGQTASGGVAVYVNGSGQLGTLTSSARFKDEIKPMEEASEAILRLKPVTFRYKKKLDPTHIPQFGLVAEEVEKVDRNLVVPDKEGKPYSVRYEAVNAMLLNEFLKEHRNVERQQATIAELKSVLAQQQKEFRAAIAGQRREFEARLKQQDVKLQRVSDQLELSKPAPQMATNNK
jgi:hypothetical protein